MPDARVAPRFAVLPAEDREFAHALSRDNMAEYRLPGSWDPAMFEASWPKTENFEIFANGTRVGVVRLRPDTDALYVSDLQVLPAHQRRGSGAFALEFVARLARERNLGCVRLRAFANGGAIRLYRRLGFCPVAREGAKFLLEKRLERPEK
jgi:ribosomal protein S18 acetylase RimI-like enzyme